MFTPEVQAKADEILADGKFAPGYERVHWEGCKHGFAVKGDLVGGYLKHTHYIDLSICRCV